MKKALLLAMLCVCPAAFAWWEDDDEFVAPVDAAAVEAVAVDTAAVNTVSVDNTAATDTVVTRLTGRPLLAVYATGHADPAVNKAFSFGVLHLLTRTGRFAPIVRFDIFLDAVGKVPASRIDEQAKTIAKQAGARFLCAVNMTHALDSYNISARIINVETGEIVAIGSVDNPLANITDIRTATVTTVNTSLRMTYLAGADADELDNNYHATEPLPAFVFVPPPPPPPPPAAKPRPVYKSFDDAIERVFGDMIFGREKPAADAMAAGIAPPAPPPAPQPQQPKIDVSSQDETETQVGITIDEPAPKESAKGTRTRVGIRTGYNASNANVKVFTPTGRTAESSSGNGWEFGLVTSTGSSHWFFNSGMNLIFRTPVRTPHLNVSETGLAIPALARLSGGNETAAIFLDAGLQFDIAIAAKDDNDNRFSARSTSNIGIVFGGGGSFGQHVEIDTRAIWSINDYADISTQRGNKIFQLVVALTYMFKERTP